MDTDSPRTFPIAPPAPDPRAVMAPLPPAPRHESPDPIDSVVMIGAVVPGAHLPAFVQRILHALDRRGLPPEATALLSVAAGGVAATAFAMGHAGAGGLLALPAIALSWLALSALQLHPGRYAPGAPHGFVEALQPVLGALLAAGLALDAAQRGSAFGQLAALALIVSETWWHAFAVAGPRRPVLLGAHERLTALALGCALGQPLLTTVLVVALGATEATIALLRLWPGGSPTGPRLLAAFGGARGSAPPWARWAAFALPVLLALVLAAESAWRF
ncbi:MAG: hypothetical protein AB7T63_09905 [Planctomycetota bacterium]